MTEEHRLHAPLLHPLVLTVLVFAGCAPSVNQWIFETRGRCVSGTCLFGRGEAIFEDEEDAQQVGRYVGSFLLGKPHGSGSLITGLSRYDGSWFLGYEHGRGYEQSLTEGQQITAYYGDHCMGTRLGEGLIEYRDGAHFVGPVRGEPHGWGRLFRSDGSLFEGDFKFPYATGELPYPDGRRFLGEFLPGLNVTVGSGSMIHPDGRREDGFGESGIAAMAIEHDYGGPPLLYWFLCWWR